MNYIYTFIFSLKYTSEKYYNILLDGIKKSIKKKLYLESFHSKPLINCKILI